MEPATATTTADIVATAATDTTTAADDQPTKPGVLFHSIRSSIRTGDILLFRGSDMVSGAITEIEQFYDGVNAFSHVGMAMWARDFPADSRLRKPDDGEKLYVLESTASGKLVDGVPAVTDDRGHLGVQLRDLDLVVEAYDTNPKTRLAWMSLQDEIRPEITPQNLDETVTKYLGKGYDASFIDLAAAAIPFLRFIRDNWYFRRFRDFVYRRIFCGATPSSWLFCSELVAQIYVNWGVFPNTVIPADVMPTDFLPAGFGVQNSNAESITLVGTKTADSDKQVPWVFKEVIRYHK